MKTIRVLDKNINLLGIIDNYDNFQHTRRFYRPGEFELRINANRAYTDKLIKNNLVLLGKDYNKVGIVLHREFVYTESGEKTDILSIKGISLQGLMSRRLIVPNVGQDYESYLGSQEAVMKHFVNKNCVNPIDPKRKINNLIIAEDKGRGQEDRWRSSYENLGEKLQQIGEYCELGWNVTLDSNNKKFVFDVIKGRDLSVNQSSNPPAIFRSDFNNIKTRHYTESIINSKNVAYTGTKEDASKMVLTVGSTTDFERIETFIDYNSDDPIEAAKEGNVKLKELEELRTFELEINPTKSLIYEKDYDLGDIVTVQDRKLKVTMNPRIVEIQEVYNKSGLQIRATFGKSIPTLLTTLKRMVR